MVEEGPTLELVRRYVDWCASGAARQRFSGVGRKAHNDKYFELHLPYTLAQKVFPLLKYGGWTDLEKHELQAKAGPYKDAIKEHWNRIKESRECMDSLGHSLQKGKWDDVLYC